MAEYWLCELGSLTLLELVESDEDLDGVVSSSKGASNEQRYFALPEGVYSSNCKLQLVEGVYSLTTDGDAQDNNPEWLAIKATRDEKLAAAQWIIDRHRDQVDDTEYTTPDITAAKYQEWLEYKQALRDIPQDYTEAESVEWPTEPT